MVEEDEALETAVSQCIESAGLIVDNPVHQKEMIRYNGGFYFTDYHTRFTENYLFL